MPATAAVDSAESSADQPKKLRIPRKLRKRVQLARNRVKRIHRACDKNNSVVQIIPKSVAKGMVRAALDTYGPDDNVERATHGAREALREIILAETRRLLAGVQLTNALTGNKRVTGPEVAVAARLLRMRGTDDMIVRKKISTVMTELKQQLAPPPAADAAAVDEDD